MDKTHLCYSTKKFGGGVRADASVGNLSWTPSLVGSASNLFCGPQQHIFKTFCGTVKEKHCCGYCGNRTTKFCGTCEEQGHGVIAVCGRRSGRECITEHQKGTSLSHGSWRSTKPRNGRSNSGPLGAEPPGLMTNRFHFNSSVASFAWPDSAVPIVGKSGGWPNRPHTV